MSCWSTQSIETVTPHLNTTYNAWHLRLSWQCLHWRWKQQFPSKSRWYSTALHIVISNKTYCLNANYQQFAAIRLTLSPPIMTLGDPCWSIRTRHKPFEGTERRKVTLWYLIIVRWTVLFCAHISEKVTEVNIWVIFNHLKASGYYMYHQG